MIQKLLKSFRKFVCSKLKTYKRNRYRPIQPSSSSPPQPPPPDWAITTCQQLQLVPVPLPVPKKRNKLSRKKHHKMKEITEKNICFKAGEYTRNPFFNFLREYRITHCGMTMVEQAVEAGAEWRCMTREEKCKYIVHTDGKPQTTRRRYERRSIYWIKRTKI